MAYLETLAQEFGVALWIFLVILVWSAVWKLLALWKSARRNQPTWFIVLALINTIGILEILYIYVFSEMKFEEKKKEKKKKRK